MSETEEVVLQSNFSLLSGRRPDSLHPGLQRHGRTGRDVSGEDGQQGTRQNLLHHLYNVRLQQRQCSLRFSCSCVTSTNNCQHCRRCCTGVSLGKGRCFSWNHAHVLFLLCEGDILLFFLPILSYLLLLLFFFNNLRFS